MRKARKEFIAQDQYGHFYGVLEHPRKDLLKMLDRKHAQIMYMDFKDGGARKVGYIIGGFWLDVFEITPIWEGK